MLRPTIPAIPRSVIGFAGVAGATHHDDRPGAGLLLLRDSVLGVHLIDDDPPARIAGLNYFSVDEERARIFDSGRRLCPLTKSGYPARPTTQRRRYFALSDCFSPQSLARR